MAKKITNEQRIEAHIASATKEELSSLIRAATLVQRAKYGEPEPPKPATKRTRGPGKPKTNGAEKEAAGVGFASTV